MQSASMDEDLTEFIREYVPARGRVLDVGGGYGETVIPVLETEGRGDIDYWCIDILEPKEGSNDRRHFVKGDMLRMDFPGGFFDALVASNVLEHVDDMDAALVELRRVLKTGGAALFLAPIEGRSIAGLLYKYSNPYKNFRMLLNRIGVLPYSFHSPHRHFLTFGEWEKLFGRYFTVVKKYGRGSISMLFTIFFHNQIQLLFRQKVDFMAWVRRWFPRFFRSAYRKNENFRMRGVFVCKK